MPLAASCITSKKASALGSNSFGSTGRRSVILESDCTFCCGRPPLLGRLKTGNFRSGAIDRFVNERSSRPAAVEASKNRDLRDVLVAARRRSTPGGLRSLRRRPLTCPFAPFPVVIRDGRKASRANRFPSAFRSRTPAKIGDMPDADKPTPADPSDLADGKRLVEHLERAG